VGPELSQRGSFSWIEQENIYISAILDQCLRQICINSIKNNIAEILILTYTFLPEKFFKRKEAFSILFYSTQAIVDLGSANHKRDVPVRCMFPILKKIA
jgi:hypothetical protein